MEKRMVMIRSETLREKKGGGKGCSTYARQGKKGENSSSERERETVRGERNLAAARLPATSGKNKLLIGRKKEGESSAPEK